MKPLPFEYVRAQSLDEALAVLRERGDAVAVLSGGQSLVPMLNMRLVQPEVVVDINGLTELEGIVERDDGLVIGALTRYTDIERDPVVARDAPLLARAVGHVGDRLIRNRGTIGGSLAQADPSGETPLAMAVLGARVLARREGAAREVGVRELLAGPYQTTLEADELITEVLVPSARGRAFGFAEAVKRHGDYPIVSVAASAVVEGGGAWSGLLVGIGAVEPTPFLLDGGAAPEGGASLDEGTIAAVARACQERVEAVTDVRAGADYRRHLTGVYVRRALEDLAATLGSVRDG